MNLTSILLQVVNNVANTPEVLAETPQVAEMNLFEMALKGGWIMIPIVLLSILAGYIFIERLLIIKKASEEDKTFMNRIKDYILEGKIESATKLCQQNDTPSARMIERVSRV